MEKKISKKDIMKLVSYKLVKYEDIKKLSKEHETKMDEMIDSGKIMYYPETEEVCTYETMRYNKLFSKIYEEQHVDPNEKRGRRRC